MKRLTILGLAALTAGTGTSLAQDFGTSAYPEASQASPDFLGLDSATQALGPQGRGRHGRGRHGKGHGGPGFQGFVLGGESGYGLISIRLRPPRPPREAGQDTQYLASSEYGDDQAARRPRFEGFVQVNGKPYGVINLVRERTETEDTYADPYAEEYASGETFDATPQRREVARVSADLVALKRPPPRGADEASIQEEGGWPGSWLGDSAEDGVATPVGRLEGVLVAFGPRRPPPPPEMADQGYQDGAPSQDFAQQGRRRGPPKGGLVFEGQVVTDDTSGQVLARMAGPGRRGPPRGPRGGGFGQQPSGNDISEISDLY